MPTHLRHWFFAATGSLIVVGGAYAQAPADLSGFWNLQAQAFLGVGAGKGEAIPDCQFEGSADMNQDGTDLSGSAELSLTAGGAECPAMLGGTLSGQVTVDQVDMGMIIMGMEQGNFSGSAVKAAKGAPAVTALAGTFSITAGPFAGTTGNWSAGRGAAPAEEIPTLGGAGLALATFLLVAAGIFVLGRRRSSAR